MNIRGRSFIKRVAAAVITGALLLSGCVITVVPNRVPMQKGILQQNLAGVSLAVLSANQDASRYPIPTETGVAVGFVVDRQTWSRKLAEALAGELARKGAAVRMDASLKLSVAVKEITLVQADESMQFKVKVSASSSREWTKDYEASAEATTGFFETVDRMTQRLASLSLAEVIKVMVNDRDFLAQFSKR